MVHDQIRGGIERKPRNPNENSFRIHQCRNVIENHRCVVNGSECVDESSTLIDTQLDSLLERIIGDLLVQFPEQIENLKDLGAFSNDQKRLKSAQSGGQKKNNVHNFEYVVGVEKLHGHKEWEENVEQDGGADNVYGVEPGLAIPVP